MSVWKNKLVHLYGPHTLYGPYLHKKLNRAFMIIVLPDGQQIQKQRAKFKMEAKLGVVLSKQQTVNHIDGNARNDRYSNLEILSLKRNIKHGHKLGLFKKSYEATSVAQRGHTRITGEKNANAVFTDRQVVAYRKEAKKSDNLPNFVSTIAKKHGIGPRSVRNMLDGATYAHLAHALSSGRNPGRPVNQGKTIALIKKLFSKGKTAQQVRDALRGSSGISHSRLCYYVRTLAPRYANRQSG